MACSSLSRKQTLPSKSTFWRGARLATSPHATLLMLGLHFIAKGGLRDFADVVAYLRNPIILVLEVLFLVVVATHAMLGVRAILTDFGLSDRAEKRLIPTCTLRGHSKMGKIGHRVKK